MKFIILPLLLLASFNLYSEPIRNSDSDKSERNYVEKRILILSKNLDIQMMALADYKNLTTFCNDETYRETIFGLLDEIHNYHDILEEDLKTTTYNHSKRTIKRILNHMDKLDNKFNPEEFTGFFSEQCTFQTKIEKFADHYNAGFATHSYGGKVYAQEVVMYRYLKRLTKRVSSIKKHVAHFHIRRKVWEH